MSQAIYTQEQLDIAILKNNQSTISKTLEKIEHRFDRLEQKVDAQSTKLEQKVDSHFHWMVGLMFGLYTMGLSGLIGALGHAYNWF